MKSSPLKKTRSKFAATTNELSFVLQPSKIAGVGVFARHGIRKGTKLRLFPGANSRVISLKKVGEQKNFFDTYCVFDVAEQAYYCPADFGNMEIGWYLNHATKPNAEHRNFIYFAKNNISAGEEITIDYGTIEEDFVAWKSKK